MEIKDKTSYANVLFADVPDETDKKIPDAHKEAIKHAMDVRKFEIELYWKRATYFWTFIGGSFVAYFALISSNNYPSLKKHVLLVSIIGFIFSYFWYFVNRGSKFWQHNWEAHVDYLEDLCVGSLYKTVRNSQGKWFSPLEDYPFSVTKINQALSLFISAIWAFMGYTALKHAFEFSCVCNICLCLGFIIVISILIFYYCKSSVAKDLIKSDSIKFVQR